MIIITTTMNQKSQLYPKERMLTWAQNGHLQECSVSVWVLDLLISRRIEITISAFKKTGDNREHFQKTRTSSHH